MRILVASPFLPFPLDNGGAIRIYHLLRYLAERHDVILVSFGKDSSDSLKGLRFCKQIHLVPPPKPRSWWVHARESIGKVPASTTYPIEAIGHRVREILTGHDIDLIQIEFLGLAHLAPYLYRCPKILVEHVITTEFRARQLRLMPWSVRRLYYAFDLLKLRAYEPEAVRAFHGCVTVSHRDAEIIRGWAPRCHVAAIPNGVDTDYFQPAAAADGDSDSVLFIGSFHLDFANIDAATHFGREIFPAVRRRIPHARLTIVGANPPPAVSRLASEPGVEVTGRVADVRPYLARAGVVVIPLRGGGGSPIRLYTAMAMQKAVVSTSLGAQGARVVAGEEIVISDDPERFGSEVGDLLGDPKRRRRMGQAARARVVAEYDWRVIGRQLEAFHQAVVDGGQV